ncbi:MAG: riboflavin biosynthesis protein RibF [Chitinivibrionales bacterium]|nr:riboflavin biosynthesis protein RibF [Chitinivibrionales bacterium]
MHIYYPEDRFDFARSVVTVGNFDGIHRGHQVLLAETVKQARLMDARSLVISFDPHTRTFFQPGSPQPLLTTVEEKARLLEAYRIDALALLRFNAELAALSPEEFLYDILKTRFHAAGWVMGESHRFGKNRRGDSNLLQNALEKNHISIFVSNSAVCEGRIISSTVIRQEITRGRIQDAIQLLGHPYLLRLRRIAGAQKATQLGFPTLNFEPPAPPKVLPHTGIYAARIEFAESSVQGALYFGDSPTYAGREFRFEFHAFAQHFDKPRPGEHAFIRIHAFIRDDKTFADDTTLAEQIAKDIDNIKHYFAGAI